MWSGGENAPLQFGARPLLGQDEFPSANLCYGNPKFLHNRLQKYIFFSIRAKFNYQPPLASCALYDSYPRRSLAFPMFFLYSLALGMDG
jgi:hypothetical protein